MNKIEDYIHQKVWNVEYDMNFDLVYIFIARIAFNRAGSFRENTAVSDEERDFP